MSHQPQRKEKDCLNCGTIVHGQYCHHCGQENVVTQQSFFGMAKHFLFDVFHFDGKFFDTLGNLIKVPGKVPQEYIAGKRMKYLDPIRMYLFTSALFFLVFFSFNKVNIGSDQIDGHLSKAQRMAVTMEIVALNRSGKGDSATRQAEQYLLDSTQAISMEQPEKVSRKKERSTNEMIIPFQGKKYLFASAFDSTRIKMREEVAHKNWMERLFERKFEQLNDRHGDDYRSAQESLAEQVLHRIPLVIFLSLPFFGLLLKLLYRNRKKYFYSDHMVFTLYHYIYSFLLMLVMMGLFYLRSHSSWSIFGWMIVGIVVYWNLYLYKGLRRFYGDGRAKTIGKYLALLVTGGIVLLLLMLVVVLFTALQI